MEDVRKSVESIVIHGNVVWRVPCAQVPLWGLGDDILALTFSFQVMPPALLLLQGSPGQQ